jgi:hypothetical protein
MVVLLSQSDIDTHFIPLLKRLSQGDWFTSRTSACALYATAYPKAAPQAQTEMRKMFADLCHDDTPMVRRAAAKALGVSSSFRLDSDFQCLVERSKAHAGLFFHSHLPSVSQMTSKPCSARSFRYTRSSLQTTRIQSDCSLSQT